LTINGLSSYQQLYDVFQQEKETLRVRLTYIKKKPYIFSFSTLSTIYDFRKYDHQFSIIIDSFNELRDRSHINRQPKRLKLVKANGRQTLKEIFQNSGMKKDLWQKFAIMNGIELSQIPKRDQLVKIIK